MLTPVVKQWFRVHGIGLLLAGIIGAIVVAPPVVWHFSDSYQGIEMLKTNTETLYVSQVQEVYDGHRLLGNPYLGGLKDQPYLFPPLSANIVATFGQLLFLSPIHAVMVWRFVNAALLVLFIYLFVYRLTGRRLPALVAPAFVLLAYALVDPRHLVDLIHPATWSQEKTFIDYGRPIAPSVSVLFFYAYLGCLWQYLTMTGTRKRWWGIASAALLGLSFYVYLYTWSFLLALNGCLALVYIWQKDRVKLKNIVGLTMISIVIGLPYLLHVHAVSLHPWYAEVVTRFGFVHVRTPAFSRLVLIAFGLFLISRRRFAKDVQTFWLAFFLAAIIVVNEQVVTNFFIFNFHYHWYYNTPLVIIFLVVWFFNALERMKLNTRWRRGLAAAGILIFLYNGVLSQIISYRAALPAVMKEQRFAPVFAWLNTHTPKDTVVLASDGSGLITSLTHNNVYDADAGIYTLTPDERLLHSYLTYLYLDNVPTTTIQAYLETHRAEISGYAFGYRYYFTGVCTGCFPDSVIQKLTLDYQSLTDKNIFDYIRRYPIDYVLWDIKQHPAWDIERRFHLPLLAAFGDVKLYAVRSSPFPSVP